MFIKVTTSGPRRYVQLVEAYRDDNGRPKQRTVATLGRLDQLNSELESVIAGLLRVTGKTVPAPAPVPSLTFESTRDYGDVWALTELWNSLGFDRLRQVFRRTRHTIDIEALMRVMVLNRLCDPDSKLGVLRWVEAVTFPGIMAEKIEHHQLLRAMDAMVEHQDEVDQVLAGLLRPMVDQDLAVVFYDMTTIRADGLSQQDEDVRKFGMSKEGLIARQVMLGVVQTADGLPLYHEVFDGNTAEVTTIKPIIEKIVKRFPVKRVIAVADRGLLSTDNLADLQAITLPGGGNLEFILAVPGRRYNDFVDILTPFHDATCADAKEEVLGETQWDKLRLIIAHDPQVALAAGAKRDLIIESLEQKAAQWAGKLDGQEGGARKRGRKLSDGGARARFYHEVCEAHLARIVKVDLKSELFTHSIDERAVKHARLMDGKLLLVTNTADMAPADVVKRYKSLADIERGFRVLKSEIEIGPLYHRLPERIRAHAAICFMALILYRVMRTRLHASDTALSPERALEKLRRIQHHRVTLNGTESVTGISTINKEQTGILAALTIKKPTIDTQLTLL
ncbi:Mobile element protein [Janthinobacterium sp. CG23_2]|nr:Mobile element protein [Janthinobacterium sp. CG23_2]CUU32545.1 Mobile element protein [Janthinobacterium sp. CG23_2]